MLPPVASKKEASEVGQDLSLSSSLWSLCRHQTQRPQCREELPTGKVATVQDSLEVAEVAVVIVGKEVTTSSISEAVAMPPQ